MSIGEEIPIIEFQSNKWNKYASYNMKIKIVHLQGCFLLDLFPEINTIICLEPAGLWLAC
jgi:hypothetical protein